MFGGQNAPDGWLLCQGQVFQYYEYQDLFALIGNLYGGDGTSTWALPDLRGRVPVSAGPGYAQAQQGGLERVALQPAELPTHNHQPIQSASTKAGSSVPTGG